MTPTKKTRGKEERGVKTKEEKRTRRVAAVHAILHRVVVGPLALRRELLLAVSTLAAGDLEGTDDALAGLELGHAVAHGIDHAAELVAEDITLLELDDGSWGSSDGAMRRYIEG